MSRPRFRLCAGRPSGRGVRPDPSAVGHRYRPAWNGERHGSLLPRYRGAATIQWAIANGDAVTGVTTMMIDAGLDTGPILLRKRHADRTGGNEPTAPGASRDPRRRSSPRDTRRPRGGHARSKAAGPFAGHLGSPAAQGRLPRQLVLAGVDDRQPGPRVRPVARSDHRCHPARPCASIACVRNPRAAPSTLRGG